MLACNKLPVARRLDTTEVDETAARYLRRVDYAPAFIGGEPLDYSYYSTRPPRTLPLHGLILPPGGSDSRLYVTRRSPGPPPRSRLT